MIFKAKLTSKEGMLDGRLFVNRSSGATYYIYWNRGISAYNVRKISSSRLSEISYSHSEMIRFTTPDPDGKIKFKLVSK